MAKLKEVGVPAELLVRQGKAHGWPNILQDLPILADWFGKHLKKAPAGPWP